MRALPVAVLVAFLVTPLQSHAATVSIIPTSSGHCIWSVQICFGDMNVGAFAVAGGAAGIRTFMTYDLSGLAVTVIAARLEIDAGQYAYRSFTQTSDFFVSGLFVDRALVTNWTAGSNSRLVYDAIGAGPLYGMSAVATSINNYQAHQMPAVTVDLAGGLDEITAALGDYVALGGYTHSNAATQLFYPDSPWNTGNGPSGTRLVLEIAPSAVLSVPIPATLPLVLAGLLALGLNYRGSWLVG